MENHKTREEFNDASNHLEKIPSSLARGDPPHYNETFESRPGSPDYLELKKKVLEKRLVQINSKIEVLSDQFLNSAKEQHQNVHLGDGSF